MRLIEASWVLFRVSARRIEGSPEKFSPELRDCAVRMVYERQAREAGPRAESIRAIAPQLGVGLETPRIWCNRCGPTEPSAGTGACAASWLKLAVPTRSSKRPRLFAAELDRPTTR